MKKEILFISILACLLLLTHSKAWGLNVNRALIAKGAVRVCENNAEPFSDITWEGEVVTQANREGRFKFATSILPSDCVGELSDGLENIDVVIRNCGGKILGFYSASQDRAMVPPGEFDGVQSFCDPGDFAVSGSWTIRADNFRTINNNLVIDGLTRQQSWVLEGVNEGSENADIRIWTRCADVPPHH